MYASTSLLRICISSLKAWSALFAALKASVRLTGWPDPIRAIARKYYHLPCSVMTPNAGRFESLRALAVQFRPHCLIDLVWQACLTYDVESLHVRRLAEEELDLPYLKITTDYSPADSARLAARIEALLETARGRIASQQRPRSDGGRGPYLARPTSPLPDERA